MGRDAAKASSRPGGSTVCLAGRLRGDTCLRRHEVREGGLTRQRSSSHLARRQFVAMPAESMSPPDTARTWSLARAASTHPARSASGSASLCSAVSVERVPAVGRGALTSAARSTLGRFPASPPPPRPGSGGTPPPRVSVVPGCPGHGAWRQPWAQLPPPALAEWHWLRTRSTGRARAWQRATPPRLSRRSKNRPLRTGGRRGRAAGARGRCSRCTACSTPCPSARHSTWGSAAAPARALHLRAGESARGPVRRPHGSVPHPDGRETPAVAAGPHPRSRLPCAPRTPWLRS